MIDWIKITRKEIKKLESTLSVKILFANKNGKTVVGRFENNFGTKMLIMETKDYDLLDIKVFTHYAHINLPE